MAKDTSGAKSIFKITTHFDLRDFDAGLAHIKEQLIKIQAGTVRIQSNASKVKIGDRAGLLLLGKMREEVEKTGQAAQTLGNRSLFASVQLATVAKRVLLWSAASAAIFGLVRKIGEAIQFTRDLNEEMTQLRKVLPKGEDFKVFETRAFDLGKTFGIDPVEVTKIFRTFAQAGLNVKDNIEATKSALLGINTTGAETEEVINALITSVKIFNLSWEEAPRIIDKVMRLQADYVVESKDLVAALSRVGPSIKIVNGSLEDLLGIITGVVEVTKISGAEIANALKFTFARFVSPDTIKAIETIAGVKVKASPTEFRPLFSVLGDIAAKWKELGSVQQTELAIRLAGARQANKIIPIFTNWVGVTQAIRKAYFAFGDAQEANVIQMESLNKKFAQQTVEIKKLGLAFAESGIMDLLQGLIKTLGTFAIVLNKIPKEITAVFLALSGGLILGKVFKSFFTGLVGKELITSFIGAKAAIAGTKVTLGEFRTTLLGVSVAGKTTKEITEEVFKKIASSANISGKVVGTSFKTGFGIATTGVILFGKSLLNLVRVHPVLTILTTALLAIPVIINKFSSGSKKIKALQDDLESLNTLLAPFDRLSKAQEIGITANVPRVKKLQDFIEAVKSANIEINNSKLAQDELNKTAGSHIGVVSKESEVLKILQKKLQDAGFDVKDLTKSYQEQDKVLKLLAITYNVLGSDVMKSLDEANVKVQKRLSEFTGELLSGRKAAISFGKDGIANFKTAFIPLDEALHEASKNSLRFTIALQDLAKISQPLQGSFQGVTLSLQDIINVMLNAGVSADVLYEAIYKSSGALNILNESIGRGFDFSKLGFLEASAQLKVLAGGLSEFGAKQLELFKTNALKKSIGIFTSLFDDVHAAMDVLQDDSKKKFLNLRFADDLKFSVSNLIDKTKDEIAQLSILENANKKVGLSFNFVGKAEDILRGSVDKLLKLNVDLDAEIRKINENINNLNQEEIEIDINIEGGSDQLVKIDKDRGKLKERLEDLNNIKIGNKKWFEKGGLEAFLSVINSIQEVITNLKFQNLSLMTERFEAIINVQKRLFDLQAGDDINKRLAFLGKEIELTKKLQNIQFDIEKRKLSKIKRGEELALALQELKIKQETNLIMMEYDGLLDMAQRKHEIISGTLEDIRGSISSWVTDQKSLLEDIKATGSVLKSLKRLIDDLVGKFFTRQVEQAVKLIPSKFGELFSGLKETQIKIEVPKELQGDEIEKALSSGSLSIYEAIKQGIDYGVIKLEGTSQGIIPEKLTTQKNVETVVNNQNQEISNKLDEIKSTIDLSSKESSAKLGDKLKEISEINVLKVQTIYTDKIISGVSEKPEIPEFPKEPVVPETSKESTMNVDSASITDNVEYGIVSGMSKVELPKIDPLKVEVPKLDSLKVEIPKIEIPKIDPLKIPKIEIPKIEPIKPEFVSAHIPNEDLKKVSLRLIESSKNISKNLFPDLRAFKLGQKVPFDAFKKEKFTILQVEKPLRKRGLEFKPESLKLGISSQVSNKTFSLFSNDLKIVSRVLSNWGSKIDYWSEKRGLDSNLVAAMVSQESKGVETAIGPTKDFGLMQIKAGALEDFNKANDKNYDLQKDMLDGNKNLEVGTWYLANVMKQMQEKGLNNLSDSLRAYNAGVSGASKDFSKAISYPPNVLKFKSVIDRMSGFQKQDRFASINPQDIIPPLEDNFKGIFDDISSVIKFTKEKYGLVPSSREAAIVVKTRKEAGDLKKAQIKAALTSAGIFAGTTLGGITAKNQRRSDELVSTLSGLGGIMGSFLGPIGAAAGGLLGGLLGGLFGKKEKKDVEKNIAKIADNTTKLVDQLSPTIFNAPANFRVPSLIGTASGNMTVQNTFHITGSDPKTIANEVGKVLSSQYNDISRRSGYRQSNLVA